MLPPKLRADVVRHRRVLKSAARAALFVACLLAFAFAARVNCAAAAPAALGEKDVQRAEKVLAKLRRLDESAGLQGGPHTLRALAGKLYPELFVAVADMRESDLKTDLGTAVFLYERVGRMPPAEGAAAAACAEERHDIYLPLCLELRGGTVWQLLLAKARLHKSWGEAVVAHYRGERGDATSRALSAMKAAREHDSVIAARALEVLKTLEGDVQTSPTYADYREGRGLNRTGFDQLDVKFSDALGRAGALLASMPRSPAYYLLSSAWHSYADGAFWRRKVYQSRKLVVSANRFDQDPLKELRLDADTVGYTVVAHWRKAKDYTRRAEQSLSRAAAFPQFNPDETRRAARGANQSFDNLADSRQ